MLKNLRIFVRNMESTYLMKNIETHKILQISLIQN
jgi:hypothetical protein